MIVIGLRRRAGPRRPDDNSVIAYGTDDRTFRVRATSAAGGDGRTCTAHYVVTDASGNIASAAASIVVPLNRKP